MAKAKKKVVARKSAARKSVSRSATRKVSRPVAVQRTTTPTVATNTKVSFNVLAMTFIVMLLVNVVVGYFANMFFPAQIVLGTFTISKLWALIYSMGALAVVDTLALPFMYKLEEWKGRALTSMEWMFQYFVLNFITIYLLTRWSELFGLGVSSWIVVVILAAALDLAQGLAMVQWGNMQKK